MQLLHISSTRRTFLQLSAALSIVAAELYIKTSVASQLNQTISQPRGYGVGAYGQDVYPGTTNTSYLPFISKE